MRVGVETGMMTIRSLLSDVGLPRPLIMGILNATPDSFSNDGLLSPPELIEKGIAFIRAGADILDVGGESSRPYAEPVSETEEVRRVIPVIAGLRTQVSIPISIDTCKPGTAREAIRAGANVINDISGFSQPDMLELAAASRTELILMHMQGTPLTMQVDPSYNDVVGDIVSFFKDRIRSAECDYGISRDRIILDPGIGFGKKLEQNISIFKEFHRIRALNMPTLIGPSRKSFIGQILDAPVNDRLEGTLAAVSAATILGIDIVRVHDVESVARFRTVFSALDPMKFSEKVFHADRSV